MYMCMYDIRSVGLQDTTIYRHRCIERDNRLPEMSHLGCAHHNHSHTHSDTHTHVYTEKD